MNAAVVVRDGVKTPIARRGNAVGSLSSRVVASVPVTAGASVSESAWDGGSPPLVTDITGQDVAEDAQGARLVAPKRLKDSTKYVEQQIGWWANPKHIVLVKRRRIAKPLPNGQFESVGAWLPPKYVTYEPIAKPVTRIKDVPVDNPVPSTPTDTEAAVSHSSINVPTSQGTEMQANRSLDRFDNALWQISFLPTEVRQRMVTRVPNPTVFEAQALRRAGGSYYTVKAVIINDCRAMVTVAATQAGSRDWQVEMTEYQLAPTSNRLPAAVPQLLGK